MTPAGNGRGFLFRTPGIVNFFSQGLQWEKKYGRIFRSTLHFWEVIVLERKFGYMLRVLYWCTDQAMTNALEKMELTAAQGHIMGYLSHRDEPACARDVEQAFCLSHPTVSGLLSRLEKKGFLEFRPDEADRRIKRIHILPKGKQCSELMHRTILDNERRMVQDFTEEEKLRFYDYLSRAIDNMDGNPCKEESRHD